MKKFTLIIQIVFFLLAGLWEDTSAQIYDGWRGIERSGIYNETNLMKTWPESGPVLLWDIDDAGTGFSSPLITSDAIYITGRKGDNDVISAFTQTGKKIWETIYGKASDSNYPDSRGTPVMAGNRILVISGQGDLVCLNTNGKIIWSVNYFNKYKASHPRFGISETPVIVDNKVIGVPGGNMAAAVAFNIADGRVIWETPAINEGTQYVNPLLIDFNGQKILITVSVGHILAIDTSNGKLLWKYYYEGLNSQRGGRRNHTNTPLYRDGYLLVPNGYSQVAVKLKLNKTGDPTVVWTNSELTPHVGGAVLLGNFVFSSTHDNNSSGKWICVDWESGKTMWVNSWHNKGSIISADGMLYIMEERTGNVGLVKPSSRELDVISHFRIIKGSGPYWAHPVINKGRLFIRHGEYLAVYSISAK